jgi:LytS/YehU family sensor histidine kinase
MYLDLESLRFEDTLTYEMQLSDKLNKDATHIPTMLIQPYVENALKHGLLHKKENRKLSVSFANSEGKNIQCTIIDNGVGRKKAKEFQENRPALHKSFAAKATEERLNLLNYGKDKKIGVEILDLYDENKEAIGTKVILSIPTLKH